MTKDEKRRLEELERRVKELESRPPQIAAPYPYYVPYPVYPPNFAKPYYPTYPYRIWSNSDGSYSMHGYAEGTVAPAQSITYSQ